MIVAMLILLAIAVIAVSIVWLKDAYNSVIMILWMMGHVRSEPVAIKIDEDVSPV